MKHYGNWKENIETELEDFKVWASHGRFTAFSAYITWPIVRHPNNLQSTLQPSNMDAILYQAPSDCKLTGGLLRWLVRYDMPQYGPC